MARKGNTVKRLSALLLVTAMLITPALAATGTVDAKGGLRLRNGGSTTAAILTTLPNGAQVEVLGVAENGWYQVSYQGRQGYVSGDYLVVSEEQKPEVEQPEAEQPVEQPAEQPVDEPIYGQVTAGPLNIRSKPTTNSNKVGKLSAGTVVQLLDTLDGWYQIDRGYISADYVKIVDAPAVATGAAAVVDYAKQFLGCRYVYGGNTPNGFDCSGFVKYVYANFGVTLNRASYAQATNGVAVAREALQPGDLVFFAQTSSGRISHVGLYIGNNQFIHASDYNTGVIISDMNSHTARGYVTARRVL